LIELRCGLPPSDDYVLTSRGLSDAQIQLISGHESKKSLEIYQYLSLGAVEQAYQEAKADGKGGF
jgi:hypothetical protein